jgi:hypothetical protein
MDSIQELYKNFEKSFPKPTKFHNDGCCVGEDDEKVLLNIPLRKLTEDNLSYPMQHFGSCFGTFEQMAYFVPRIIELLSESELGFNLMGYACFRLLVADQDEYKARGVWDSIEQAMLDILHDCTNTLIIEHYDAEAGWSSPFNDLSFKQIIVEEFLALFFYPVLNNRNSSESGSDWDRFFEDWATDENAGRVAWLLEVIRQYCHDILSEPFTLPDSLLVNLTKKEYIEQLIDRARPAIENISSPTWFNDLMDCLPLDTQ